MIGQFLLNMFGEWVWWNLKLSRQSWLLFRLTKFCICLWSWWKRRFKYWIAYPFSVSLSPSLFHSFSLPLDWNGLTEELEMVWLHFAAIFLLAETTASTFWHTSIGVEKKSDWYLKFVERVLLSALIVSWIVWQAADFVSCGALRSSAKWLSAETDNGGQMRAVTAVKSKSVASFFIFEVGVFSLGKGGGMGDRAGFEARCVAFLGRLFIPARFTAY